MEQWRNSILQTEGNTQLKTLRARTQFLTSQMPFMLAKNNVKALNVINFVK